MKIKKFTLIEILFVTSIFAILLAILLPSLRRAKEYAYDVVCKSNLRQIGVAYKSYKADYRNQHPSTDRWLDDFRPLYPYLNTVDVFICPKSHTELKSSEDLLGGADYYISGNLTDNDRNNGHGNSPYHLDISNPGQNTLELLSYKRNAVCVYDKYYTSHFGKLNILYLEPYQGTENGVTVRKTAFQLDKEYGVLSLWTLDVRNNGDIWLVTVLSPFPDLDTNGNSSSSVGGAGTHGNSGH
ncbi:MAG: hypothetical protein A2017_16465 [Lentisphaerae bacterium GWF2_44_16]|nr:MAG: hypothetical protein A2017_16465 [Lentisphaerae bacterium GWF2_44_16]